MWNGFYLRHTVGPHSLWFVCCLANIDTRYSGGWKERNVCHGLRLVTVVEKHLSNCRFSWGFRRAFCHFSLTRFTSLYPMTNSQNARRANWVFFLRIFIIPLPKSYTPTRAYFNKFDLNACFDFIAINVVCVCLGSFFVILFVKFTSGNFNRVN